MHSPEYESVKRGWAFVGDDGILRANPDAPHPRNCGFCGARWHKSAPCDENAFQAWGLPPSWLVVAVSVAVMVVLSFFILMTFGWVHV